MTFLVVGHVCRDIVPGGEALGGCATYAALTVRSLGARVRVATAFGADLSPEAVFAGISVHRSPAEQSTTFQNIYGPDGRRRQRLLSWAGSIGSLPPEWQDNDVVLLGPVAQEVPMEMVSRFPDALLGMAPQGWMREWDREGNVRPCVWPAAEQVLCRADAAVMSAEDVPDVRLLPQYAGWSKLLVITEGSRGATVYRNGGATSVPGWPAHEVDATGAGDVFAAAFLLHLAREGDPLAAAGFANCVASFAVERSGITGIPGWEEIRTRWEGGRGRTTGPHRAGATTPG